MWIIAGGLGVINKYTTSVEHYKNDKSLNYFTIIKECYVLCLVTVDGLIKVLFFVV